LHQFLLLDVGAYAANADPVNVVKVIAHVKFVEMEWNYERGECRWVCRRSEEGEREFGTVEDG